MVPPLFACLFLPRESPRSGALVAVALEFASRIEVRSDRLVLCEVSGLDRLFGDAQAVGVALGRAAVRRGLAPRIAVAATRTAARFVASARPGVTVVRPGAEAATLAPLPLEALGVLADAEDASSGGRPRRRAGRRGAPARHYRLAPAPSPSLAPSSSSVEAGFSRPDRSPASGLRPPISDLSSHLATLARWGVRTLGELAALPPADLSARLGAAGPALCRLARGEDPGPLVPELDAPRFEASLDLEWPIEDLEPLSFVLARLLEPLSADLDRADRGAVTLALDLRLVTRETWTRTLDLPAPIRDPRVLRTLVLLDLESHPPPAGIDRVAIEAVPSPGPIVQHSLIEPPLPSPDDLSTLMARLTALMGEGRSGTPALVDSHRPGAFEMRAFTPDASGPCLRASVAGTLNVPGPESRVPSPVRVAPGVLRRFRAPVAATVSIDDGRPVRVTTGRRSLPGGAVEQAAGPWRTSGEWWGPSAWDHDEWDVLVAGGAVYRLSRDRVRGGWVVEGVVD